MKLSLSEQNGVWILTGNGDISEHDIQVLKAGLTKLFNSGKNRIVIDLPEAERIPPQMLREIAMLDITARELSGRIVLAGINERLRQQIAQFAVPPVVECVESKDAAVEKLLKKPEEAAVPDPAAAAAEAEKAKAAKSAIRQKELAEPGELRKKIESLQKQNVALTEQLKVALVSRRVPAGEEALKGEISTLEEKVAELLKEKQALQASSAKPQPAPGKT